MTGIRLFFIRNSAFLSGLLLVNKFRTEMFTYTRVAQLEVNGPQGEVGGLMRAMDAKGVIGV